MERKVARRPFISHEGAIEPHRGNNSHTGRDLFSRSDRQWISTNDGDVGMDKKKKPMFVGLNEKNYYMDVASCVTQCFLE